ncbi:hypothetical protein BOX15_Mlig011638g3 [Macrostomum lignano]|uniref:Pulmonary surfactant-associated protein B n=1 Tax=Macrostomum lignano TaxID=282301 RepID=A0A267DUC8_9PLAT|nr:hypothetical protein BOX15_Mlig011638g3 [Macrostomum lignano]
MRVLFSLGLLILAVESTAAILLGQNRCTWGPSYWCTHLGTVKECSSVGYCGRIWRTAAAPSSGQRGGSGSLSDANGDCGFCRLLASDLQRLTLSNRTASPAETQRLAASACGLVPEPRHRSICLAIVSTYMPEIVALFRDGLPADRLCPALSLCGTGRRDPRLTAAAAAAETPLLLRGEPVVPGAPARRPNLAASATRLSGEFCDLCVELVGAVKQAAQRQSTIAEVAQAMKTEVCARLGGSQSLCNMWVDTYLPEVMRSLAAKIEPKQICTRIKFCQSAAAANGKLQPHPLMQLMLLQRTAQKPLKDVECQVCEMLVSEARQMIRDNRTQEEIIEFVKNRVCNLVPAEKDKCIRAVTEYGPIIFQLLASELDPNTVCQALGACGKTDSTAARGAPASGRSACCASTSSGSWTRCWAATAPRRPSSPRWSLSAPSCRRPLEPTATPGCGSTPRSCCSCSVRTSTRPWSAASWASAPATLSVCSVPPPCSPRPPAVTSARLSFST